MGPSQCVAIWFVNGAVTPASKVWEDRMLQSTHSVYLAISSIR
jgi:hypothetical protein